MPKQNIDGQPNWAVNYQPLVSAFDTTKLSLNDLFVDKIREPVEVILVEDPRALPIVELTDLLIEFVCEV